MWKGPKNIYTVEAVKLNSPVSIKPKATVKKPLIMSLIAVTLAIFVSGGSVAVSNEYSYAQDFDKVCPVNTNEEQNKALYLNGGLTTAQIEFIQTKDFNAETVIEAESGGTFSEKYKDNVRFVGWVPAAGGDKQRATNFPEKWSGTFSGSDEIKDIAHAGHITDLDILPFVNDRTWCRTEISWAGLNQTAPNAVLGISKFIYNITDTVYTTVMGGSINITEVVALNTEGHSADTFDELYVTEVSSGSWMQGIADQIEEALTGDNGLYETLYLYFLLPLVFIGSIVIIINLVRTQAVKGLTGIVWMVIVIALGTVVLQTPMAIPKFVDGAVGTIGNTAASAITGADNNILCTPENSENESDKAARAVSCQIWETTIYQSWIAGQFGERVAGINIDEVSQIEGMPAGKYAIQHMYSPEFSYVVHDVAAEGGFQRFFDGQGRMFEAFIGLISISAIGFFVLGNAALLVAYQISMLLLIFTAPFFFLIGILPSQSGKGIFLRWVELVAALFIKRIVVTIFMAVFIKMFILIGELPGINLIMKTLLFIVLTYIGFSQRGKIIEMFAGRINFGGDKSINVGASLEKAAEKSGSVVMSAGIAGAGYAGAKALGGVKQLGGAGVRAVRRGNLERVLKNNADAPDKQQQKLAKYVARTGDNVMEARFKNADGRVDFKNFNKKAEAAAQHRREKSQNIRAAIGTGFNKAGALTSGISKKAASAFNNMGEATGVNFAARAAAYNASQAAQTIRSAASQSAPVQAIRRAAVYTAASIAETSQNIQSDIKDMAQSAKQGASHLGEGFAEPLVTAGKFVRDATFNAASSFKNNNPNFAKHEDAVQAAKERSGKTTYGGSRKNRPPGWASPYGNKS